MRTDAAISIRETSAQRAPAYIPNRSVFIFFSILTLHTAGRDGKRGIGKMWIPDSFWLLLLKRNDSEAYLQSTRSDRLCAHLQSLLVNDIKDKDEILK